LELLDSERKGLIQQVASLKTLLAELSRKEEELNRLREEKRAIVERLEKDSGRLKRELEEVTERLSKLRGELSISENVASVLKHSQVCPVCGSQLSSSDVERILAEQERKKKELMKKIKELEAKELELKKLLDEIQKLSAKLSSLEERELKLSSELQEKPRVELQLEELQKRYREVEDRLKELKERRKKMEREMEQLKELLSKVEQRRRMMEEVEKKESMLSEVEEKLGVLLGELGSVEALRKRVEELREMARSLDLKERVRRMEERLREVRERLQELLPYRKKYEELLPAVQELEKEVAALEAQIRGEEASIAERRRRIEEKEKLLERVEEELERISRLRELFSRLDKLIVAWNETLREVRDLRIAAINRALKLVWREVYNSQYADYTDVDFRVEESRNGYTYSLLLKTTVGGRDLWRSVEELSGGERTLALIALRLAVSYLLSGRAGFIIMDEPTHNLDENLTRRLAFFLRDASRERGLFRQVIVITHDPVFSEAADVVYRFEREKSGDDPTMVVREK